MSLRFFKHLSVAFLNYFILIVIFMIKSVAFLYISFIVMNESGY